jgi:hypothetical protein
LTIVAGQGHRDRHFRPACINATVS